jgi:hypothetical protein
MRGARRYGQQAAQMHDRQQAREQAMEIEAARLQGRQADRFLNFVSQQQQRFDRYQIEQMRMDERARVMGETQQLANDQFEFKLTAQQKQDQANYQNALYQLQQDDSFSPEEKDEAERLLFAAMAGIEPLPTRREPSEFPDGQAIGQYWEDPRTGMVFTRDSKGDVKKIGDIQQPGQQDVSKLWQTAFSAAQDIDGNIDEAKARRIMQMMMSTPGMQQQGQAPSGSMQAGQSGGTKKQGGSLAEQLRAIRDRPDPKYMDPQARMDAAIDTFIPKSREEAEPGQIYIGSDGKARRKAGGEKKEPKKKPKPSKPAPTVSDASGWGQPLYSDPSANNDYLEMRHLGGAF